MFFTDHTGLLHFCFDDSACSGGILGVETSPEGCCLPPGSGGVGAGSYAVAGDPQCLSCMEITGENDSSIIISTFDDCSVVFKAHPALSPLLDQVSCHAYCASAGHKQS